MRQEGGNVPDVIGKPWQGNDQQRQLLAEAVAEVKRARVVESTAWQKMQKARDAGVPDTVLCLKAEVSRATLNRKLGARRKG
jgi:hypothetical protein